MKHDTQYVHHAQLHCNLIGDIIRNYGDSIFLMKETRLEDIIDQCDIRYCQLKIVLLSYDYARNPITKRI